MAKEPDREKKKAAPRASDDEARLFEAAMRDVEQLADKGDAKPAPPAPLVGTGAAGTGGAKAAAAPDLPELHAGSTAGSDARTMERLRRGRLRPQARLDLHGLTQDEAHRALVGFVLGAREAGRRCVLVITGRGRASFGAGVLRAQAPRWLNTAPLRAHILGFAEAQPKDGGAGALYVLLRRRAKG